MGYFHFHDAEEENSISRWRRWVRAEHAWKRLCIGIGFFLLFTAFLNFREVKVEVLELNTTAERYVIGQIGFDFPDVEAMTLLKQEEVRDIGSIYQLDSQQVQERVDAFQKLILEDQSWRERSTRFTFEELQKDTEMMEVALLKSRFTDARTLQKMQNLDVPRDYYFQLAVKDKKKSLLLPKNYWQNLKQLLFQEPYFYGEISDFVIDYFSQNTWQLQEDLSRQIELRGMVEEKIPQKYTHFEAGKRIIDAGEKVSPRHIAILSAMKDALTNARSLWNPLTILGSAILSALLTILSAIYLRLYHKEIFNSLQKLTLLFSIFLLMLTIAKGTEFILLHKADHLINVVRYPIFVPFAVFLVAILIGREIALFSLLFLTIIMSLSLAVNDLHFLAINLVSGMLAMIYAKKIHKRRDIFSACAKTWFYSIPVILAFNLTESHLLDVHFMWSLINTFTCLLVIGLLIIGLLPIFESFFDLMTDMMLIEYMDPSNELLRRLSLELPGTYQHCLVVGNISEAAASAIGANGLFCRVSTLYHDIGKLSNPHYFTENQLGGFNIHQLLTPQESAQVIMAHVKDGESLARKYHLPKSFIDIIREHHGTTLVYYFYRKQLENAQKVDPMQFRYPGPKPKTKESAIIMIADSVEAASRSLDDVDESTITQMVDAIVSEKQSDGQLDECQLTFEELGIVKKNIVRSLLLAHHLRIKYPARQPCLV